MARLFKGEPKDRQRLLPSSDLLFEYGKVGKERYDKRKAKKASKKASKTVDGILKKKGIM